MNKKIEANYQQPITKHQSGITLVALVVTIIILLILGGIAISLISGEEGLFAKANHAESLYNNAALAEVDRLNKIIEGNYISTKPLDSIPELTTTDLSITISPDTNINPIIYGSGVMVTLEEKAETGYQLQYSINGGQNYKNYTAPFEVTEYGTVILARLYDTATEREGDSTATYTITNIDILPPNEFNLSASSTGTSITVSASGTVTDANATDTSAKSAIVKYEYKLDSGNWITPTTATDTSYTFTGLTAETSHTVSMRATDTAGNVREATNKGYSINTISLEKCLVIFANEKNSNGWYYATNVRTNYNDISITRDFNRESPLIVNKNATVKIWYARASRGEAVQVAFERNGTEIFEATNNSGVENGVSLIAGETLITDHDSVGSGGNGGGANVLVIAPSTDTTARCVVSYGYEIINNTLYKQTYAYNGLSGVNVENADYDYSNIAISKNMKIRIEYVAAHRGGRVTYTISKGNTQLFTAETNSESTGSGYVDIDVSNGDVLTITATRIGSASVAGGGLGLCIEEIQ